MNRPCSTTAVIALCAALFGQTATAADQHHHGEHGAVPTEPGQGAFAAISEIVALLENDPATDWSKIDIDALREHLQDMIALTLGASAVQAEDENGIRFTVTGSGATLRAIHAMVPAHGEVLDTTTDWTISVETNPRGAVMHIAAAPDALERIRALGFFGVMATGARHQAHHLQVACGDRHVHSSNQ